MRWGRPGSVCSLALSTLLALANLLGPGSAAAQDAPTAVIVFDNSGSMWGKIEGDKANKLSAARSAIAATLEKLDAKARTGLVTFGRRRGDCADIEVAAKPDAGDPDRINAPLDRLNPRGRGPIVQATREAAKAIGAARPANVILIHDDLDNCQQDVCAAANDIKRDHPGLKVHVISVGMKKEDVARMSCLAGVTGGRQFDAQSAPQLAAFIGEALQQPATSDARPSPPQPTPASRPLPEAGKRTPAKTGRRPQAVPETGLPGLWLSAVLGKSDALVEAPVSWRVLTSGAGTEVVAFEALAVETRANLPPGTYAVEARTGLVVAKLAVEVVAGRPTGAVVPLEAGAIRLVSRAQAGGQPIDQVTYSIYDGAAAKLTASAALWIGRDPAAAVALPPGTYQVVAERGFARAQRALVVTAGTTADADMALGAGLLTLRAAARDDGETLANAVFIIAEDDPEAPGGRRELARSAAGQPDFVLPAGTYTVTARIGGNEVRDRVPVGAGESVRRTMILELGKLALNTRLEQVQGQQPWREAITYRVTRRDAEGREVARGPAGAQTIELPAGNYRIEAQVGSQNARVARDVELQAGRTTQLALELQAARATLRLGEQAGSSGHSDVAWEVRDDGGRIVWRGTQAEPRLVLAPGRYLVSASLKQRRAERALTLRAGETRLLDIGSD
jgi:Ca-activated chloride channel family protein